VKLAIDLRGLHSGKISGVENYIINILERLVSLDRVNNYMLFENAYRPKDYQHLKFVNAQVIQRRWPNKLFNASLKLFGRPLFEQYFGDFDCLFLPNVNFFAASPNKKLVVTIHDLSPLIAPEFYNWKRRLWHRLVNFEKTLRRADHIIAVSEYTKSDIVRLLGISPDKISVIYPGIDQTLFKPDLPVDGLREVRNLYGLPGEFILFLNTLEPRKNLVNFIKAYEKIDSTAALIIGGKVGWKYKEIFATINASPKRRSIKYLGYIPEEHKPYLIRLANVVGFPSFYEGFGFPALEALSVGVPVLASQITSLPETVNQAALLVDPYNIDDMAQGLDLLLHDASLRQNLINKGFEQAQKFKWETAAEKLLAVFNGL
jgi:glycosyltransferase involved in cell wall biosynthesis